MVAGPSNCQAGPKTGAKLDASQGGRPVLQQTTTGIEPRAGHLSWLMASIFAFFSNELEDGYEAYQRSSFSIWTWGSAISLLMGWPVIFMKLQGHGKYHEHLLPPLVLPFVLHFLPTLALNLVLVLHPALYAKHKRVVNGLVQLVFVGNCIFMREAVLWMKLVERSASASPSHGGSWIESLLSFPHENIFLFVFWQIVALFPSTLGGDMAMATLGLIVNLAGNGHICSSPLLGPAPATLAPGLMRLTQRASDWLLAWASPYYVPSSSAVASCAAALGFWQALGWLNACLVIIGSEVLRRRAFLRTTAARACLGPSAIGLALSWPFGSQAKVGRLIRLVFMLLMVHSIIWAVALDFS
eukprot:jgi/Botrbrau1/22828/Bobra.0132s0151.1